MKRMGTFFKYALWIVLFFIFSEFIINVGLNSSYTEMKKKGNTPPGVNIEYAKSTLVNGKVKGTVDSADGEDLTGKYAKVDLYSERDNLLGTQYIPIQKNPETGKQEFQGFFELQDADYYNISIVDAKGTDGLELLPREWTRSEILWQTIIVLLLVW